MAETFSIDASDGELAFHGCFGLGIHAGEVEFCQVETGGRGAVDGHFGGILVGLPEIVDGVVAGGLGDDAAGLLVLDNDIGEI